MRYIIMGPSVIRFSHKIGRASSPLVLPGQELRHDNLTCSLHSFTSLFSFLPHFVNHAPLE